MKTHPGRAAEAVLALGLFLLALASSGLRSILATTLEAAWLAARSVVELMLDDPLEVLPTALASVAIPLLLYAPVVRAAKHVPAHRRAWLGPYLVIGIFVLPMTFAAFSTPIWWIALVVCAAMGWVAAPLDRWRVLALLPTLIAMRPMLGHSPLGDWWWTPERLADRCEANAGQRARGAEPETFATRHYAITPVRDDLALFTSERVSAWLHVHGGQVELGERIDLPGNIWQGCIDDGAIWFTKRGLLMRVAVPDDLARTSVEEFEVPDPPEGPHELDFADVVCGLGEDRILITEVIQGAIREVDPRTGEQVRTEVGGGNIQALRRSDGLVVGIDTARLFVFDPNEREVIWREGAGICVMGIDQCASDGRVAITDMAGRLRLYQPAAEGYELIDSIGLRAPRRVAFSPDCERLAVTSADDVTVYVLSTDPLEQLDAHALGPGLRDLAFVGPRTIAAADACTVTTLDAE
jgi:hypothetical protein